LTVELLEERMLLSLAPAAPTTPLVAPLSTTPAPAAQDATPDDSGEIYIFGDTSPGRDATPALDSGSSANGTDSTDEYPIPPAGSASQQVVVQLNSRPTADLLPLRDAPADVVSAFLATGMSAPKAPTIEAVTAMMPATTATESTGLNSVPLPLLGRSTALGLV